jgi:uncharacterized protein YkwD
MNMRFSLFLCALLLALCSAFTGDQAQVWTAEELAAANTAKNARYLDSTEQAIVMYCNLARMYPKKFSAIEVSNYVGTIEQPDQYRNSQNRRSLMADLQHMTPVAALQPDSLLTEMATCFQLELAASGNTGHKRIRCTEDYLAENCSFGKYRAKDIVLQLLIDEGVASLGHRKNILNAGYSALGVAFGDHKKYRKCTVMDFR